MPKASLAQVGQGDPKVIAHPGFRELPACQFDLGTDKARRKYDELARLIWNAGRLSIDRHMSLSAYALAMDQIERSSAEGKAPRPFLIKQLQDAQKRLGLDDLDKPISAPKEAPVTRFSRFGFERGR